MGTEKEKKKEKKGKEQSFSEVLDELIELKKNETSALKKIFESLKDRRKVNKQ